MAAKAKSSGAGGAGGRALPDLVSRIRVDSGGVDAAVLSLIHSFGKADLAIAATAAGIGLLLLGAKSMYQTYEKIATSEAGLKQAVDAHNASIGTQAEKSADLAKAQKELAKTQHELALYDLEHHASAGKTSQDLKGHAKDLQAAQTATKQLTSAQVALENFDTSHSGHVINAAQLRQRELLLGRVQAAQAKLSGANRDASTIDSLTSRGHSMTAAQLAHRQDLLDKVASAQSAVNDQTAAGGKDVRVHKLTLEQVQAATEKLISTNRRFVSDQSQVYDGYAKLIRGGLDLKETDRVMNDAIDLSALKHISLSEAVDILNAAEHGRMRGLIDLGITTKQLTDANGNLLGGQKAIAEAMHEVDTKVAHGRDTISDIDQKSNKLNNDWQDLSKRGGPVLETMLDTVITKLSDAYDWFDRIGKDDRLWAGISDRLSAIAGWIRDWIIIPLQKLYNLGLSPTDPGYGTVYQTTQQSKETAAGLSKFPSRRSREGKAAGGQVLPYGTYRVGEEDEELLVMGARGGYVMPNTGSGRGKRGSGGDVHITVNAQTNADPRQIATEIGWELRKLRRAW